LNNLIHFIEVHWGDLVSLLVLCAGIALVVFGPHEKAQHLGEALSAAALVGLKLRGDPSVNRKQDQNPRISPTPPSAETHGTEENAPRQDSHAPAQN
jgi:hypothetical protein